MLTKIPFGIDHERLDKICMHAFDTEDNEIHEIGEVKTIAWNIDNKLIINHLVLGTYAEEIINRVAEIYDFKYARIRVIPPSTCYGYHTDEHSKNNIHIPIQGDFECCFFIIEGKSWSLEQDGSLYLFNGKLRHTAVNASNMFRFHLHFEACEKLNTKGK